MTSLRMDKLRMFKQMLLSKDCVVKDINPTRCSQRNVYILLNFFLLNVVRYHCVQGQTSSKD